MRVVILGSAAGGGVPQWNCGCRNCNTARAADATRTQSCIAVSADLSHWVLLNASPDLRQQLAMRPALWPRGPRASAVSAVVLTDGEIDHTLGLLLMREAAARVPVYAPAGVASLLSGDWPVYRVLEAYAGVSPHTLPDGERVILRDEGGKDVGLACTAIPLARRPPRYAREAPSGMCEAGLRLENTRTGAILAYIPTAGAVDAAVRRVSAGADLLLFDGTFWSDDELRRAGVAAPTAREMGHVPIGGEGGSLALLPELGAKQTVFVHINNTNPILDPASPERAQLKARGIEVGEDGMEFEL